MTKTRKEKLKDIIDNPCFTYPNMYRWTEKIKEFALDLNFNDIPHDIVKKIVYQAGNCNIYCNLSGETKQCKLLLDTLIKLYDSI
jgi:hypothetical protein